MTELETIREARAVMGNDVADMTDAQLAQLVAALDSIADMVLDVCIENHRQAVATHNHKKAA